MSLNNSVEKSKEQGPLLTVLNSSSARFTSLLCVVFFCLSLPFPFFFFFGGGRGDEGVYVLQRTQKHTHARTLRMHTQTLEIAEGIS